MQSLRADTASAHDPIRAPTCPAVVTGAVAPCATSVTVALAACKVQMPSALHARMEGSNPLVGKVCEQLFQRPVLRVRVVLTIPGTGDSAGRATLTAISIASTVGASIASNPTFVEVCWLLLDLPARLESEWWRH